MTPLSELRPEQSDKWAITSIDLELDRLAWRRTPRPLNERLWELYQKAIEGRATAQESAELDAMCDQLEAEYESTREGSEPNKPLPSE